MLSKLGFAAEEVQFIAPTTTDDQDTQRLAEAGSPHRPSRSCPERALHNAIGAADNAFGPSSCITRLVFGSGMLVSTETKNRTICDVTLKVYAIPPASPTEITNPAGRGPSAVKEASGRERARSAAPN
jgi:hypothetical protein